ncbi:MAG TPA: hypothetical protein PK453_27795 [Leptospiraceae bacterium]|nr:hypothetical protein [Leptospiraceae bacterium]HNF17493.1 hypothetical protein [Leptospiraceae bacterium]HNF27075.1 hypothetical protein [Leptospiraceae bacterium]HNH08401.1 hypothetical protein [Leptospiraceae bacterium]HNI25072.1 hypothetical protein [Leptospiraceae bacterium]
MLILKAVFISFILFFSSSCFIPIVKEIIECERNRDPDYPSAVSNCQQTQKEYDKKHTPEREIKR